MRLLVDEEGNCRDWGASIALLTPELAVDECGRYEVAAGNSTGGESVPGRLARADVRIYQSDDRVTLAFHDAGVSSKALAGAIVWLAEHRIQRVLLRQDFALADRFLICSKSEAIKYLSDMIEERVQRQDFYCWTVPLRTSPLVGKVQLARDVVSGSMSEDTRTALLNTLFEGQYTLMRRTQPSDTYLPYEFGADIHRYSPRVGTFKIGRPFRELEARQYGARIDEVFDLIHPETEARAEMIETTLANSDGARDRLSYRRIVLPFQKHRADWILTASVFA